VVAAAKEPKELDALVGKLVTVRGKVRETKIPQIHGIDVKSDEPDLRGKQAEATGYLRRDTVTKAHLDELSRNGEVANRSAGTFYRLQAVNSDDDAQVHPIR
jgi:hypothetical protein